VTTNIKKSITSKTDQKYLEEEGVNKKTNDTGFLYLMSYVKTYLMEGHIS